MTPFAMSLTEVGRWRDTDFPLCSEFGIGGCLRRFSWRNTVYDGFLRREAFNRSGSAASARLTLILSTSPSGLEPTKIRKEGRVGRINGGEVGPDPRPGNLPQNPVFRELRRDSTSPIRFHSAGYLPVSELSSFSSHEIRVIWKVISCPLKAN